MDSDGQYEGVRGNWTGDVWKSIPVLRELLPLIRIDIIDCAPTGIAVLSKLDLNFKVSPHRLEHFIMKVQDKFSTELSLCTWLESQNLIASAKLMDNADALKRFLSMNPV